MLRVFPRPEAGCLYLILLFVATLFFLPKADAQVLPLEQNNALTAEWLVYDADAQELVPYVAAVHSEKHALHQWVTVVPSQPFRIGFVAQQNLCVFLNNQLIFKADSSAAYRLNISEHTAAIKPVDGKMLLTVWHPAQQPNVKGFYNDVQSVGQENESVRRPLPLRIREYVNQNAFIIILLLIGLMYGWLRINYPAEFQSLFDIRSSGRNSKLDEGMLAKPISSWSSILFILAFSLSMALLIAAIHTNVQHIRLFNRLLPVSEANITTKVGIYTLGIFLFVLMKYLFLKFMAFIFGLEEVVVLQYREFIKTLLFLGVFLPFVMLLYLSMNAFIPEIILLVSNILVSLLLLLTVLRVFAAVNKKATVLNLHLFSYLCATEVIPLAVVLKLIVFSF
ncbi:DUF4271 domain-containing protein [uncultured Pontibacter sp.]|uniref:DUF4271 domain-containing protein n=1 Tax=uncultured Pontibacter sp. TaxID=453356 RepID=UPI0026137571|nr:DUF4271 domain-containing protein [uncultured Pontibacter sp.]